MNLRLEGGTEKRNNWSPFSLLLNIAERERPLPILARNRDVIQYPEDSPEMPFSRPTSGSCHLLFLLFLYLGILVKTAVGRCTHIWA